MITILAQLDGLYKHVGCCGAYSAFTMLSYEKFLSAAFLLFEDGQINDIVLGMAVMLHIA